MHSLHVGTPEWIVESVKTVHLHEEIDIPLGEFPPEWERMTWFAFLISCGDEAKLAKIMDEAFNKVITN